jgi:hypothetical protein
VHDTGVLPGGEAQRTGARGVLEVSRAWSMRSAMALARVRRSAASFLSWNRVSGV